MIVVAYINLPIPTKGLGRKNLSLLYHVVIKYTATVLTMGGSYIEYQRRHLSQRDSISSASYAFLVSYCF